MSITKKKVLKKLIDYFKYETSSLLEILDIPSEAAQERGGYTGVTIAYIQDYVVPNAEPSILIECINELLDDNFVAKIFCENIRRIVIEKHKSDQWHYRDIETQEHISSKNLNSSSIFDIKNERYRDYDDEEE